MFSSGKNKFSKFETKYCETETPSHYLAVEKAVFNSVKECEMRNVESKIAFKCLFCATIISLFPKIYLEMLNLSHYSGIVESPQGTWNYIFS